jgi:hypothetical protein
VDAPEDRLGSWLCENSSTRRTRRNISKKLRIMESNDAARAMFDTLLELAPRAAAWATRPNLMAQHAQIAEHKYCRPHARPFRLRFARVVAVFPVCSPAAL